MLVTLIGVALAAAAIKLFFALCGHQITMRLAAALALLVAFLVVLCL